jgi:hypothetical protein
MWWMTSGNEQLDKAAEMLLEASQKGDMAGVICALPSVKTAIGDLPLDDDRKRAVMASYTAMVEDLLRAIVKDMTNEEDTKDDEGRPLHLQFERGQVDGSEYAKVFRDREDGLITGEPVWVAVIYNDAGPLCRVGQYGTRAAAELAGQKALAAIDRDAALETAEKELDNAS